MTATMNNKINNTGEEFKKLCMSLVNLVLIALVVALAIVAITPLGIVGAVALETIIIASIFAYEETFKPEKPTTAYVSLLTVITGTILGWENVNLTDLYYQVDEQARRERKPKSAKKTAKKRATTKKRTTAKRRTATKKKPAAKKKSVVKKKPVADRRSKMSATAGLGPGMVPIYA